MLLSHPRTLLLFLGALLSLCSHVAADAQNYNPTGDGCVDSKGFLSCYSDNVNTAIGCVKACNTTAPAETKDECVLGCYGAQLATDLGCWIQSCWNQVYSCEYQLTAIAYFEGLALVQQPGVIPFYPPPQDASAGACSCNLGYVYGNLTYIDPSTACITVAGNGDKAASNDCSCCQFSLEVSNALNACPTSDLSIFDIDGKIQSTINLVSESTDNCAVLDNNPNHCTSDLGFPYDFGKPIYNVLNLTGEPGTDALSNIPGTPFTDFGAPAFTLQLFPGVTTVLTPAPFNSKAAAATGGGVSDVTVTNAGGAAATGSTSPDGTGAGAGAGAGATGTGAQSSSTATAAPTKKNDAGAVKAQNVLLVGSIAVVLLQSLL